MAFTVADIDALAVAMERRGIGRVEIDGADGALTLVVEPAAAPKADLPKPLPAGAAQETAILARASIAGRFLSAHPWRSEPLATVGQAVAKSDIVGLVQVGPLYVPVTAPADGIVEAVLAEPGTLIGYGTPVARLRS